MKKILSITVAVAFALAAGTAQARNTEYHLPINTALHTPKAEHKLDGSVKFYFDGQAHPKVLQSFGSGVTNKKSNSFGKADETACNWAFMSGLIDLQKQAKNAGANAVINIVSYYRKDQQASPDTFECHAGAIIAAVALKGDFVRIN